jgi:SAM-dependent methyltransferase
VDPIVKVVGKLKESGATVKHENVDDRGKTDGEEGTAAVPWGTLPSRLNPEHYETGKLKTVGKREKKRQQIGNMIAQISTLLPSHASTGRVVAVDFCCGSGHVGLVLAAMRPDIDVYFLDCNAVALAHAKNRAAQLQISNVKFLKMDIREYPVDDLPFHVGFALHGCGPATDFVLDKCLAARASYVMCPCCVGFIQNERAEERVLPSSEMFRCTCGVTREEFIRLSQRADHTSLQGAVGDQGQYAMRLVNEDRNCLAREYAKGDGSYATFHYDMYPRTCSPKNQMIIGRFTSK